jgi:methylamine dehydrogenase heavy chain
MNIGWLLSLTHHLCLSLTLLGSIVCTSALKAESGYEQISTVALPEKPSPHWVWVNDASFDRIEAGRAALVDGDTGKYLGALTTGVFFMTLALPSDYHSIYSLETYYSRGVRGERTDIVRIYDPSSLQPVDEIAVPTKRGVGAPTLYHTSLTEDDRFLLIYNYTPSQSISVVDLKNKNFVGEIETPGCVLAYPDGPRTFHSLCGDGSVLKVELNNSGGLKRKSRLNNFFDPDSDPIQEDAVRVGDQWLYVSYGSRIYPLSLKNSQLQGQAPWSLLSPEDKAQSWRCGGLQLIAVHEAMGRLYVLMHQGDEHSQELAGTEVWVYDLYKKERIQRIKLRIPAISIQLSRDLQPLLFASAGGPELDIYDAMEGKHLRTANNVAAFSTVLQVPWKQ